MRDQLLLQTPEVEVPTVAEQLRPMLLVLDMQRIPPEKVQQLRKDLPGPVRYAGRDYRWRPQKALAIQARENLGGGRKKDRKAQGEEIGRVAGPGEDVPRDLEMPVSDLDEDLGFKELRYESWYYLSQYAAAKDRAEYTRTAVELSVCEQFHKLRPVLRPYMVACASSAD